LAGKRKKSPTKTILGTQWRGDDKNFFSRDRGTARQANNSGVCWGKKKLQGRMLEEKGEREHVLEE